MTIPEGLTRKRMVAFGLALMFSIGIIRIGWCWFSFVHLREEALQSLNAELQTVALRLKKDLELFKPCSLSLMTTPLHAASQPLQVSFQTLWALPFNPAPAAAAGATVTFSFMPDENGTLCFSRQEITDDQLAVTHFPPSIKQISLEFDRPGHPPEGGRYLWELTADIASLTRLPEKSQDPPGPSRALRIDFCLTGEILFPYANSAESVTIRSSSTTRAQRVFRHAF